MFIKIKLEPQSVKALSPLKKISYFSINEDATILDLKIKIEKFVDVPAERQEVRTLTEIFQNSWYVKEVCDVRGSAIMLYAYDETNAFDEPQFVCFLQVYTNELAAQQQELEQRSKQYGIANINITPNSSTSSITLFASSDTDRDSGESDSDMSSSTSNLEIFSSCTDNSDCYSKKRCKENIKCSIQSKKLKVAGISQSQYSADLCQYLEEFPICSKEINLVERAPADNIEDPNKCQMEKNIPNDFLCKSPKIIKSVENGNKFLEDTLKAKTTNTVSTKLQVNIVTTTYKSKNNFGHPCYSINPEIRDYLAIICSNDMSTITNIECEELLSWFFDQFRTCDSLKNLQFDITNPMSLFDGKLWIACMNLNTFQWMSANIIKYSLKSYKILSLNDSKQFCDVVIPVVSNTKHALDIFDLLEKQNKNITTLKWSLLSRQPLLTEDKDFNEKAVSTFCTNELFNIAMDTESRKDLEILNFKLKYCFWQIVFKFIEV